MIKEVAECEFNKNIAGYSGFKTGGNAEILFTPKNQESLIDFLKNRDKNLEITVIGGGYNLLIRDGGINGVVILTKNFKNIFIKNNTLVAESGVLTSKLFNFTKANNIGGFEFLGCIPGTVGGACKMNAGCYNCEIKDIIIEIKAVDFDGNIKIFSLKDCNMEYRKNNLPDNLIFLETKFVIGEKKDKNEIEKIFKEMMDKKIETQPLNEKTCGSVFKNLSDKPAWKIIKELGLQDVDINGTKFSEKHANFLVNNSSKYSSNIENAIDIAQKRAKSELNIDLELEIKIVGNK
jgi:UDP-N-acetylmuramate dehydrogenase